MASHTAKSKSCKIQHDESHETFLTWDQARTRKAAHQIEREEMKRALKKMAEQDVEDDEIIGVFTPEEITQLQIRIHHLASFGK